ncbi:hypothetical protein FOCG_15422 [Fusarium oxysporum f. sp. radicis-lycopersici 26381]|nr:hypothetical protein FOCG_15422 [Fusarium oxysporum f. sp. radicis-lycopersici 26381]
MAKRIRKVLKGHLEWIFDAKLRGLARDPSCPHTWIDGKEIAGWKWNQYFAAASLVDAPFHLIKAGDFFEYDQGNTWNVPRSVGEAFKAWLKELDPKNKLGSYAFPRDMDEPTHSFYLTDHVLIWRGIKSAESLELKSYLCADITPKKAGNGDNGVQSAGKSEQRHYSSSKTQNQILKRFTAENPVSKKPQATFVSFFAQKDTSLLHAMDSGFFDKSGIDSAGDARHNKIDIWKNLIDCQPLHDDNDDTAWDEPVRFALSIVLAQKGRCMNSLSPKEMCKRAITVLRDSAWHNGLFPGQLDLNGEPIIYEDELKRDQYWANTFEVPFTLWKFMQSSAKAQTTNPSQQPKSIPMTTEDPEFWIAFRDLMENKKKAEHMASNFPWNHVVDQTNIVQLSDEWLYNVPHFFGEPCSPDELDIFQDIYYHIFNKLEYKRTLQGVIIDVKRSKAGKKAPPKLESLSEFISEPDQLLDRIKNVRTPSEAKKRLFAFFSADPRLTLLLPQSLQEFGHLLFFLRRHNEYDKYFYEHTEIEGNLWTTEFHLSFHVLDPEHPEDKEGKDDPDSAPTTGLMNDSSVTVDRNYVKLGKVAMGFRFDGDLFDRYWTCHFLDSNPQEHWSEEKVNKQVKQILQNLDPPERHVLNLSNERKAPWRQRRVLELLLFQRMIDQMKDYTLKILEKVKSDVWKNTSEIEPQRMTSPFDEDEATFQGLDFDTFQKTSDRCQRYQRMLQKVDQDMTENFAKIELWLNREHERQTERPRWTFNDEIRYRSIISKLNVQNDHTLQDLRRSHTSISSYNESLTRRLESLRNDLEQRRADDIKRFTYVTVVFLPLGFATGIFSMSNALAGHTVWKMVVTAFMALATTFILLLLSERLEEGAKLVIKTYPKWVLWPWNKIKKLGDKTAKETHKEAEQQNEGHAREEAGNRESGSQRRGNGASSMV